MIEINLLPIRAARKRETFRSQVTIFILIILLTFACIGFLKWNLNQRERRVDTEIDAVKKEIARLNEVVGEVDRLKKDKERLERKLAVIEKLEQGRLTAARILDELSQKIPEKIWFESLARKGNTIEISGVALDNETIANFMTVLERSSQFSGVELDVTKQVTSEGLKLKEFSVRCSSAR
jgi:type IV pilus assembly protein PilN